MPGSLLSTGIDGVRRAIPDAKVGGPETAGWGGEFARTFYEHCLRGRNHATAVGRQVSRGGPGPLWPDS